MTTEKAKSMTPTGTHTGGALSDAELRQVSGGSQSTGAGAGKVTFNPFTITRKMDAASPIFF